VPIDYQRSVPAENRDASNAGGFARVDLVSTVKLAEKLGLNLRADNLLGNRIFSPPFDNAAGYDAEWQGRSLRAQLTFRY
jgi:hypothetical protein